MNICFSLLKVYLIHSLMDQENIASVFNHGSKYIFYWKGRFILENLGKNIAYRCCSLESAFSKQVQKEEIEIRWISAPWFQSRPQGVPPNAGHLGFSLLLNRCFLLTMGKWRHQILGFTFKHWDTLLELREIKSNMSRCTSPYKGSTYVNIGGT